MDDWKPSDPKLLEFDYNALQAQDFAEILGIEPLISRILFEYRNESVHVFQFEQLMKLKGVDDDTLALWTNPTPTAEPNPTLQQAIGLPADAVPLFPDLLEALCKTTQASGCIVVTRTLGETQTQTAHAGALAPLAPEIPEFVLPIQEDLVQMKMPTIQLQVLGYEEQDLVIVPASAFYIAALQPTGSLTQANLDLWQSLSLEVRKRYPSKIYIDNHAKVTETDIAFDCPSCHLRIVVDANGAGYNMKCPRCRTDITVPDQTTSHTSFKTPEQLAASASS